MRRALDVVVVARPWPDRDGVNIAAYDVPAVPLEPDGMVRRNEFLAAIDRIVYGPMPSDGLAVGQTFIDAKARFSFDLAPGFRLHARRPHHSGRRPKRVRLSVRHPIPLAAVLDHNGRVLAAQCRALA